MVLKVNTEKIENRQAVLTIKVEPERVERSMKNAAQRISQRTSIPGFRSGKAPYHVVERTMGREAILDEALEELGNEVYGEALEHENLDPIARAQVEVVEREPLVLRLTIPLKPVVELGDYKSIRVEPKEAKVEKEELEKALAAIQGQHGQWAPVERPVRNGDLLNLDIEGMVENRRVMDVKKGEYLLQTGSGVPVAGFPELIEGLNPGEERAFSLSYPLEHPDEKLAGRRIDFKVRLNSLKEKQLPALDDELAKMAGDFKNLEALKARVESVLLAEAEAREKERVAEEVLEAIASQAKIEYPPILLERELNAMLEDYARALARRGFTLDRYLKASNKSLEDLRKELRPRAEERLRKSLILGQIVEDEKITVPQEDIDKETDEIAASYGDQAVKVKEALLSPESQATIRSRLLSRKAIEHLIEVGTAPQRKGKAPSGKFKVLTLQDLEKEKPKKRKKGGP